MNVATNSLLAAALAGLVFTVSGSRTQAALNPFDESVRPLEIGDRMPATSFVNQGGRRFTFAPQQTTLVGFIYTRCRDACPVIAEKFGQLDRSLGPGPYHFVLVSIDPVHDTPPVLAAYAKTHSVGSSRLDLLTGDPRIVGQFVRSAGLSVVDNGRGELIHNSRLLVVSRDGRLADVVGLVAWDPRAVGAELQHVAGVGSSPLARIDYDLTKTVAQFCGGSYQIASGIIDVAAVALLVGGGALVLLWMRRRVFAQGA